MMVDGSSGEKGIREGVVLINTEGVEISYTIKIEFKATNNQVEYKAFIVGLTLALVLQVKRVKVLTLS